MEKGRAGLYNIDTNKQKSNEVYGDGKTESAMLRKRRQAINTMNKG
jgi:hypothetical protein